MDRFPGTDNLGTGLTTSALLPPVPPPLELSAGTVFCGGIVVVSIDGSTTMEGAFDPTPASSPEDEVRGTLSAGLKKVKQIEKSNSMKT